MAKMTIYRITISMLIISMLTTVLACGGGGDSSTPASDNPESASTASEANTQNTSASATSFMESVQAQKISDISHTVFEEERIPAIEEIVCQGFTLGLVDENSNQLNPNVPAYALSLYPEDVAAHAAMVSGGNYRTVGYVVHTLVETEVVLASTDEVITLEDFLLDLQAYVDWSFANPDDPESNLGLLIGSGCELEVPTSAPTIDGDTMISPLASLMMMSDILLGIEEESPTQNEDDVISKVLSVFSDDAYAEKSKDIKGFITRIKPLMGELLELVDSDKWKKRAIQILTMFESNNRFAVRMVEKNSIDAWDASYDGVAHVIDLNTVNSPEDIYAFLIVYSQQTNDAPFEVVKGVPASFDFVLTSPNAELGDPLYDDADAQLIISSGLEKNSKIGFGGSRAIVESKMKAEGSTHAITSLKATKLSSEIRTAALLASATIETRLDKVEWYKKLLLSKILGMDIDEIDDLVKSIKPAPWVCSVRMIDGDLEFIRVYHDEDKNIVHYQGYHLNGDRHGRWVFYYEDGDISAENNYKEGKLDGTKTVYYSNPPNTVNCRAEYKDGELIWEKCYLTTGQKSSETTPDGTFVDYNWDEFVTKKCFDTPEGRKCLKYCGDHTETICDEYMLDDYGYPINEGDGCDTMCD
ncbi:MAG: hypothetical protein GY845_30655 [Planctomycetes bacterium]|nr:hypothetical protein [Planctomycetota bacterium]